jgi:hypothetical protein
VADPGFPPVLARMWHGLGSRWRSHTLACLIIPSAVGPLVRGTGQAARVHMERPTGRTIWTRAAGVHGSNRSLSGKTMAVMPCVSGAIPRLSHDGTAPSGANRYRLPLDDTPMLWTERRRRIGSSVS